MKNKGLFLYLLCAGHFLYSTTYLLGPTPQDPGFFSIFLSVLGALDFYEKLEGDDKGLIVDFGTEGLYYDVNYGPNWWEYYFEPIKLGTDSYPRKLFLKSDHCDFSVKAGYRLPRERGYELIQKYIKVRPNIQEKIDLFVQKNFEGYNVVGIHYRGTDKVTEAPAVKYQVLIDLINVEIAKDNNVKIFVATDEERFLETMRKNFHTRIVATDAIRSLSGRPVHYKTYNDARNYQKGEDAVIDCILLSKCSKLIKTSSNLSTASARFNPFIEVVLLNKFLYEQDV